MRLFHYAYSRCYRLSDILFSVAAIVASFALAVIRFGSGQTWHSLRPMGVSAYRVVGGLRPVYRESYDTHGLSLAGNRWRC